MTSHPAQAARKSARSHWTAGFVPTARVGCESAAAGRAASEPPRAPASISIGQCTPTTAGERADSRETASASADTRREPEPNAYKPPIANAAVACPDGNVWWL